MVEVPKPRASGDISRPVGDSFRHTGHGSPFGTSWGSPAFLDPAYLSGNLKGPTDSVELRAKSIDPAGVSRLHDRRKKCVSEHFVKERKSNASKQFSYNKLVNEKGKVGGGSLKHKPNRPPQPNIQKEGMLIDLSPSEGDIALNARSLNVQQSTRTSDVCILDEPIEIPTEHLNIALETTEEDETEEEEEVVAEMTILDEDTDRQPPPYKNPPTYSNTIEFSRTTIPGSPKMTMAAKKQQNLPNNTVINSNTTHTHSPRSFDPFDTSYLMSSSSSSSSPYAAHNQNNQSVNPSPYQDLDTLTAHIMSSMSSPLPNRTAVTSSSAQSSRSHGSGGDHSLNDSLNVNLSSLSLNDGLADSSVATSTGGSSLMLDKSFLAELEKDLYKNETANKNLNMSGVKYGNTGMIRTSSSGYEKTFSSMAGGKVMNVENVSTVIPRPVKSNNNTLKSTNRDNYEIRRPSNYEPSNAYGNVNNLYSNNLMGSASNAKNYVSTSTLQQQLPKPLNAPPQLQQQPTQAPIYNDTNTIVNQIWYEKVAGPPQNPPILQPPPSAKQISSSSPRMSAKNHNFVAISNRQSNYSPQNLYSSVAGDIYSSIYDTVDQHQTTNNGIYSPGSCNSLYAGATAASLYNNVVQPAIYDEVAELRPHRPAPQTPQVLSAQQIQRRLEKQKQDTQQVYGNTSSSSSMVMMTPPQPPTMFDESHRIAAFLQEVGDDSTEDEARYALNASNWDQAIAVRLFKVDRLVRYV